MRTRPAALARGREWIRVSKENTEITCTNYNQRHNNMFDHKHNRYMYNGGGARGGESVVIVNVTLLSIIMWWCLMPRARLERMVPSRRGHV